MAQECSDAGTANNLVVSNNNEGDEEDKQEEERAQPQQLEMDSRLNSQTSDPISSPLEQVDHPQSHSGSLQSSCEGGVTPVIRRCIEETCHGESSRQRAEPSLSNGALTLTLSPPGSVVQEEHILHAPSVQSEEPSPISSEHSCMSLDLNMNGVLDSDRDQQEGPSLDQQEGPSLVLMGCTNCHIYVMVSEINPSCPSCKSCEFLVDAFQRNLP